MRGKDPDCRFLIFSAGITPACAGKSKFKNIFFHGCKDHPRVCGEKGQNPAVMAECGFLSNPDEAAALSDSDYQKKVAFVLMQAILEFYAQQ